MRLMKSIFGYRYMITDGWGRDLFPPDNSRDGQAGAQGDKVEAADEAQEVRLEEYCSTTGKPTHLFRTKCASLDSV